MAQRTSVSEIRARVEKIAGRKVPESDVLKIVEQTRVKIADDRARGECGSARGGRCEAWRYDFLVGTGRQHVRVCREAAAVRAVPIGTIV